MNIRKKIGKKPTQKRVLERENTQNCASLNVLEMAERTGLEPATPGVTGRYSNQLNYRSAIWEARLYSINGGADGTRTRDPRRDRPVF